MAVPEKTIGGFPLKEKIRTGPHLAVFASEDNLGREVEVACYRATTLRDRTGRDAFLEEARRTADLHHENLCPVVNAGEEEGIWFAVSVAPKAPSLRDLLDRGGALAAERVEVVAERSLAALDHLHGARLRHGDIRPETIFLSRKKVLLAPRRLIPLALAERDLRYLSPEELRAEGTDIRADLFSLGMVLFEALTGQAPSSATDPEGRRMEIEAGIPDLPGDVPPGLGRLVRALLAPRPEDRPATPEAAAALLREEEGRPATALPPEGSPAAAARPAPAGGAPAAAPLPRRRPGSLTFTEGGAEVYCEVLEGPLYLSLENGHARLSESRPEGALACIEGGSIRAEEGADPRPRINGSLFDRHDLESGDVILLGDVKLQWGPLRADRRRPPPQVLRRARHRRAAVLLSFLLSLAALGWGASRVLRVREEGSDVFAAAAEAEARLAEESEKLAGGSVGPRSPDFGDRARSEFEAAQQYAREHAEDFDGIEKRFLAVRKRFGPTAYAYLAQKELDDLRTRRREAEVRAFEALNEEVSRAIEDDRLSDAVTLLDNYARHHEGTPFGARAERDALNLEETIAARFDEDMMRADRAAEEGEFGVALDILGIVRRYGGPDERAKAERRMREIRLRIQETQVPGGEPAPVPTPGGAGTAPPEPESPPPTAAEEKAGELLAKIRKAFTRKEWEEVLSLLEKLAPYEETSTAKAAVREIDRMRGLARLEALGVAALFHGKTKVVRGLTVEISYDFSDPEQAKDWFYSTPFAHPLSGNFWVSSGGLHGRGVGAAVHPGEFEADTLELRARIRALEPHDFGFLMLEPEDHVNYFLYAVQNRFFVIKLDRPVHENSLWVVGSGAWSDTPDGYLGMVRKNGSPDPAITKGEWVTLQARKEKGTMAMVIKGKEIRGAARGDNNYVFPALQPAVYVITGDAIFDDIVIRGTLRKEWVEDRMRFLRRRFSE